MALCAPYDKTGIDQVQAERLSMSWLNPELKENNLTITPTRKASIPEGACGPSALATSGTATAPSWKAQHGGSVG